MNTETTPRLVLRRLTDQDRPLVSHLLKAPDAWRLNNHPDSPPNDTSWLSLQRACVRSETADLWVIRLAKDETFIGCCGLLMRNRSQCSSYEIRCHLDPAHRHNGFATEAVACCMRHAFTKRAAHEVFASVSSKNLPAMNLAIRSGMTIRKSVTQRLEHGEHLIYVFSARNPAASENRAGKMEITEPPATKRAPQTPSIKATPATEAAEPNPDALDRFSPPEKKIALFMSLFDGRRDVHARRRYSARHRQAYYMPACRNEYLPGICGKPKQKCGTCPNRAFIPYDAIGVRQHLTNTDANGNGIIGLYPLLEDETCRFLVLDFDGPEWMRDVSVLRGVCDDGDIPCVVERSRSGNGAHLWFFFTQPIPATLARQFGSLLITQAMNRQHGIRFASYDRMFPNQDTLPKGGFGNLIALPLQGAPRKNGGSVFVDADFMPFPDQWAFLAHVEKLDAFRLQWLIQTLNAEGETGTLAEDPEETDHQPWARPRATTRLRKKDFPKTLRVIQANRLFVEKNGLSQQAMNRIKRLAAFTNPAFHQKQRLRLSTYDVPRIICSAEETTNWIALPRGCRRALETLATDAGTPLSFEDKRTRGKPIDIRFTGSLRMDQTFAMDALASEDDGVLAAATAFGKTVVAAALIAHVRRSTLIIVHTQALLAQWKKSLSRFLENATDQTPVMTGQKGGGKNALTGFIDIMTVQSLRGDNAAGDDLSKNYGMVIVDECHHVPAFTIEKALASFHAHRVHGLTATPVRKDGLHPLLFMQCGPIRHRATAQDQAAHGAKRLMLPRVTRFRKPLASEEEDWSFSRICGDMVEDEERNALIISDTLQLLKDGRSPLVLTQRTDHVRKLGVLLREAGQARIVELIGAETARTKREKEHELAEIADDTPLVILATGQYVGEGFDMPRLDTLQLAMPISWKGRVAQYAGRLHREHAGKGDVRVYDYVDIHVALLERMYQRRLKAYAQIGYCTAPAEGEITGGSVIFDTRSFIPVIKQDFACAKTDILIVSPFVKPRRAEQILDWLSPARSTGVAVHIVTRPPDPAHQTVAGAIAATLTHLRKSGIRVTERPAFHQKFILIDQRIVWYGSLNLLSFGASEESLMRLASREIAAELQHTLLP